MLLRAQLKVLRYGLLYFDCNKTVSVVPLKNTSKVIAGNNTSKGSMVEIQYGSNLLKAEIIAVNGEHELYTCNIF